MICCSQMSLFTDDLCFYDLSAFLLVFLLGYLFFPQDKTNMLKKKVTICIYLEFPYIKKGNKKILREVDCHFKIKNL